MHDVVFRGEFSNYLPVKKQLSFRFFDVGSFRNCVFERNCEVRLFYGDVVEFSIKVKALANHYVLFVIKSQDLFCFFDPFLVKVSGQTQG